MLMVIIEMENGGKIKIELDRAAAPNTVKNFTQSTQSLKKLFAP